MYYDVAMKYFNKAQNTFCLVPMDL